MHCKAGAVNHAVPPSIQVLGLHILQSTHTYMQRKPQAFQAHACMCACMHAAHILLRQFVLPSQVALKAGLRHLHESTSSALLILPIVLAFPLCRNLFS